MTGNTATATNPEGKLAGKLAIVTGASRGIGLAIAQRLVAGYLALMRAMKSCFRSPGRAASVIRSMPLRASWPIRARRPPEHEKGGAAGRRPSGR